MTNTPHPESAAAVYESALRERRFLLQQCRDCGQFLAPPQEVCVVCGEGDFRWVEASGWGLVLSFGGDDIPGKPYRRYRIALDEGVEVSAPVIEPETKAVRSGMKVLAHVAFEDGEPAVLFTGQEEEDEW